MLIQTGSFGQTVDSTQMQQSMVDTTNHNQFPDFDLLVYPNKIWHYHIQPRTVRNTIIFYFNPECEHCQWFAHNLQDSMVLFSHDFFIFVSYHKPSYNKAFASFFKLTGYKNIVFGKDVHYYLPGFFKITETPFVAIYNNVGILEHTLRTNISVQSIDSCLNRLSK
ncbi:MAG: hypothetical protein QM528_09385 [Phycisphaerales bacterium]|nr:hypothetical protein [Phycisphaerales bacterium]